MTSTLLAAAQARKAEVADGLSAWNYSLAKRLLDWSAALVLLVMASPVMAAAALAIRINSPGPVFFRQSRVGRHGRLFAIVKFRTMQEGGEGPGVTRQNDSRVTGVGRLLRKWKIDELPQLWNVLSGQMSLVGPRPDLPQYILALGAEQHTLLSLLPGLTGAASLQFRNEEAMLATVPAFQLEEFYVAEILPRKVSFDLTYARQASLRGDLRILLRTFAAVMC
jgi:lipopolysaccharide/colanic/teichoic acid biosynthesis glycosyltransferase